MQHTPFLVLHVKVVRISTSVIPASTIFSAIESVINSFLSTNNLPFFGLVTGLLAKRPTIRSYNFSITEPFLSLINARTTTPSVVPQSSSLTIISCETSTRRLVKYPESAVLRAVSAEPLRAPCVDKKNSSTDNPSTKFDVTGISTGVPSGLAIKPRIPANCVKLEILPRALEFIIMKIGLSISSLA